MNTDRTFTLNDLRQAVGTDTKRAMLTCYDFTTAQHLDAAGVPMLLVGDSASNVILGYASTLPVALDFMIRITAAVKRGAKRALVMGDMPFGSYHENDAQGVRNVVRMIQETNCDCVKIEASPRSHTLISLLAEMGIAVVAHLGLRPQAVGLMGGYRFQGRTSNEARQIVDLSKKLVDAGASSILLEAVPPEVSQKVVDTVAVPIIGCGAGPACHAHVVVLQDLMRLTPQQPRFVPAIQPGSIQDTARSFVTLIESHLYPDPSHCYQMPDAEKLKFKND